MDTIHRKAKRNCRKTAPLNMNDACSWRCHLALSGVSLSANCSRSKSAGSNCRLEAICGSRAQRARQRLCAEAPSASTGRYPRAPFHVVEQKGLKILITRMCRCCTRAVQTISLDMRSKDSGFLAGPVQSKRSQARSSRAAARTSWRRFETALIKGFDTNAARSSSWPSRPSRVAL